MVPDGLIGFLYGPFEGRVNDTRMLKKFGLQRRLRHLFSIQGQRPLYLFGDKAYKSQQFIMAFYVGIRSRWHKKFNKKIATLRIGCENAYGITQMLWLANVFKCQLKLGFMPV